MKKGMKDISVFKNVATPMLSAAIGALIGSAGTPFANPVLTQWSRADERRAVAAMLEAEIEMIVHRSRSRGHVAYFTNGAGVFKSSLSKPVKRPSINGLKPEMPEKLETNLPKLGLLGADMVRDVTVWYNHLQGVQSDLLAIVDGTVDDELVASLLCEDIEIWTTQVGGKIGDLASRVRGVTPGWSRGHALDKL